MVIGKHVTHTNFYDRHRMKTTCLPLQQNVIKLLIKNLLFSDGLQYQTAPPLDFYDSVLSNLTNF